MGAAYQLTKRKKARVTVIELSNRVGGNAGSFYQDGIYLDYGSHRLHPACHPEILDDIRKLLGEDLRVRPRHGRIRLNNRWIHFPLKAGELMLKLSPAFSLGVARDMVGSLMPKPEKKGDEGATFASELRDKLGKTICNEFYFPYARKIWGLAPEDISVVQAEKRVSANSFGKLIKKVLARPEQAGKDGEPIFYYPKRGFGQITEAFYGEAEKNGATFLFNSRVTGIETESGVATSVRYVSDNLNKVLKADYIWSTLPITLMARAVNPKPADDVISAARDMKFRSMVLIYMFLETDTFTEYDAHYFPEIDIPVTRLSEVKNYSNVSQPSGLTCICAELPCDYEDKYWHMSETELADLLKASLEKAAIPVRYPVKKVIVKKLRHAYPIYNIGYEENYNHLDEYLQRIEGLLFFGRQGLFVHDNTHHALYMARSAADCIRTDGSFDTGKWKEYRREFESHVVVD